MDFAQIRQDGWGTAVPAFEQKTVRGMNFNILGPSSAGAPAVSADYWIDDVYFY